MFPNLFFAILFMFRKTYDSPKYIIIYSIICISINFSYEYLIQFNYILQHFYIQLNVHKTVHFVNG